MEKLLTSKTLLKMAGGRMNPSSYPAGFAPGIKLQKPLKESGIF